MEGITLSDCVLGLLGCQLAPGCPVMLRVVLKDDMDLVARDADFDKLIGYTLRQLALLLDGAPLSHLDNYYRHNAS